MLAFFVLVTIPTVPWSPAVIGPLFAIVVLALRRAGEGGSDAPAGPDALAVLAAPVRAANLAGLALVPVAATLVYAGCAGSTSCRRAIRSSSWSRAPSGSGCSGSPSSGSCGAGRPAPPPRHRDRELGMAVDLVMVKGAYDRAGGPETVLQMMVGHLDRERYNPLLALLARPREALPPILSELTQQVEARRLAWQGLASTPATAWTLDRLLRQRPGAILHTNDMRADLLAYLITRTRRVPWIAHVHGWLGDTHAGRWRLYEQVDGWLIRGADLVLVGSNAMAQEVKRGRARWVEIVTNGIPAVDPAAHDAAAAAIRARIAPDGRLVVGLLGRLHPGKGHALLIEAIARLRAEGRDLMALFVGEGPAEAEYRALAQERGIAEFVHFAGLVRRSTRTCGQWTWCACPRSRTACRSPPSRR